MTNRVIIGTRNNNNNDSTIVVIHLVRTIPDDFRSIAGLSICSNRPVSGILWPINLRLDFSLKCFGKNTDLL